jgi:Tfp pilus assembly protein PilN
MTQQINLLEPSLRPRRQWCSGRDMLVAGAVLAVAVLGHYVWEQQALARVLAAASAPVPAAVDAPAGVPPDAAQALLLERQARVRRDEALLQTLAGLNDLPRHNAQRLQGLIAVLPQDMWLQEVQFSGARGVRIAGGALNAAALAAYARRLGEQPAFQGLPLHVVAVDPREAQAAEGDAGAAAAPRSGMPTHYAFVLSSVDAEPGRIAALPKGAP